MRQSKKIENKVMEKWMMGKKGPCWKHGEPSVKAWVGTAPKASRISVKDSNLFYWAHSKVWLSSNFQILNLFIFIQTLTLKITVIIFVKFKTSIIYHPENSVLNIHSKHVHVHILDMLYIIWYNLYKLYKPYKQQDNFMNGNNQSIQ